MSKVQYQFRLDEKAADMVERWCMKQRWSPSETISAMLHLMDRLQRVSDVFSVGVSTDGEKATMYRLPSGEFDVLDGNEAEDFMQWFTEHIHRGLAGAFLPDDPIDQTFGDMEHGEYPENAIGAAMMALDGTAPTERPYRGKALK